jgi:hypothetical protein
MRRFFRPSLLVALLAIVVVGAAAVVFQAAPPANRPTPLPVAAGDREIAWLYPATAATNWERFVAAVRRAAVRLRDQHPDLTLIDRSAFPPHTTATPEVVLAWSSDRQRLIFRWYKLTSDWKTRDCVEALLRRQPPPLAVIGGNTSDAARELAGALHVAAAPLNEAERPLLLLTSATADFVPVNRDASSIPDIVTDTDAPEVDLNDLYGGRTFRFCFTNEQMADAVTQFVWQRDDLRPDSDPVHVVRWNDDTYSRDLWHGYLFALQRLAAREAVADWVWATGCVISGGLPGLTSGGFPVPRAGAEGSGFRMVQPPTPQLIDSSVGTFLTPNRFEEQAAGNLLDLAMAQPQRRPLLVVTGQAVPSRRFLRALARLAPDYARRFVVVTGGAISFNTVYRDRQVAWPVQDLPFRLVFFCHNDPVDPEAGFRFRRDNADPDEVGTSTTGTDEVLLNGDIVESLAQSFCRDGSFSTDANDLADRVIHIRLHDGRLGFDPAGRRLFRDNGNRHTGTGEHVVCVLPRINGRRVLPQSTIEVWARHSERSTGPVWELQGEALDIPYDDAPPYQGEKR